MTQLGAIIKTEHQEIPVWHGTKIIKITWNWIINKLNTNSKQGKYPQD